MRRRVDERRRAARQRIALPVSFEHGGGGVTRDISAVGLFLTSDHALPASVPMRLSVTLGEWDSEGGFRVHGEGRVVREDTGGPRPGTALEVVWLDIEPLQPPAPAAAPPVPVPAE